MSHLLNDHPDWPGTAHESALQRMVEAVDAYRATYKE